MNINNQIDFEKVNDLVIFAKEFEDSRKEKRNAMIEIASETLERMLEIIKEKEDERKEYYWLKKEIIGIWVWKITQTPRKGTGSKYKGQRYWTVRALKKYVENNKKIEGLRHEHVIEKGKIADAIILSNGTREHIKKELVKATCCIVTKEEHKELHKSKEVGWKRYIDKDNIKVVDLVKTKILSQRDLEALQSNAGLSR